MNICFDNIAIINKPVFELTGITVVAGLNKTGKTTIAKAVYAMISAYRNLPLRVLNSRKNGIEHAVSKILRSNKELSESIIFWLAEEDFVSSIDDKDMLEWIADKEHKGLRAYIDQWIHDQEGFEKKLNEEADVFFREICAILERPSEEYERFLIESFIRRVFNRQISCFYNNNNGKMSFSFPDNELRTEFVGDKLSQFSQNVIFDMRAIYMESINLLDLIKIDGRVWRNSRGGRMEFSQPASSCISMLHRIANEDEESYEEYAEANKVREIIAYIVEKVTHGSLKNESSGIRFFEKKGQNFVELSNLSAGLKVFVVLQTLLENGALKRGDILLIDEPEINLHPEWQIVLAEILVLLRKELGIVIYINSHSPYFIRAIEVKLAQNEMTLDGKFYLTVPEDNLYRVEDVTQEKERIYELLYKPLEEL